MGTNPICVIANGAQDDSFELDMATSTVAVGKVSMNAMVWLNTNKKQEIQIKKLIYLKIWIYWINQYDLTNLKRF